MPSKIIIVLCEGPHDVAFLNKLIKTVGFKSNESTKIEDFPSPINSLIPQELKKINFEELNLMELRNHLIPSNALAKDDKFIFLYPLGGDSKKENRIKILRDLHVLIPSEGEITEHLLLGDFELSVLYFFDADENGVNVRLNQINNELIEAIEEIIDNVFESHASFKIIAKIKFGNYIFSGEDNNTGKLEDILVPLMKLTNEDIFQDASNYIEKHHDKSRLFPLKINFEEEQIIESRSDKAKDKLKFDKKKALIAIAGQLQKSGGSNVVCIGQTDYLTLNKIIADVKCQEILNFFKAFIE